MWWNDKIKAAVTRKEAAWKEVFVASNEETKERCMEAYKEEKRKVKRCIIQTKKKVNEQFGKNMNGNRKLFWKEVSNVKGGKLESRIKDGNGRLVQGEDEVRKIWFKEYFEDLYKIVGCHNYMKPLKGGSPFVVELTT